jgi:hypothetical protein
MGRMRRNSLDVVLIVQLENVYTIPQYEYKVNILVESKLVIVREKEVVTPTVLC